MAKKWMTPSKGTGFLFSPPTLGLTQPSELLCFHTLSTGILNTRKHNVSDTRCFRLQVREGRNLLCLVH
jgi:hypothetical protein